jgi:tRNA-2-methylthio-N6-dimethylallyladenosine synthase
MTGRTNCDRIVVWDGNERQAGNFLPVLIHDANSHTLFGSVETTETHPDVLAMPELTRN